MSKTDALTNDAWLVVPLFNEGAVVGQVIQEARQTFPNIVCIDDGSSDDSVEQARAAGAVVVEHPFNLGQGAALQTGIEYVLTKTTAEYLITFDADGQHSAANAMQMLQEAKDKDLAIVFGSRFLSSATQVGSAKRAVLKTAALVTRWKTGLRLTDAHNGLRLLRRDAAQAVHLKHDRMAHASEIVDQLAKTGLPWSERPVEIAYTDYSKSKGQSLLNSVNILVDLVLR